MNNIAHNVAPHFFFKITHTRDEQRDRTHAQPRAL